MTSVVLPSVTLGRPERGLHRTASPRVGRSFSANRMHPRQFAALLAALAFACQVERQPGTAGGDDPAATVRQLEERLRQGMVTGDTVVLGSLWAPEYLSTSAVGHTSNRTESLMAYGSGLVNVDTAVVRDLVVRPYGTTAVGLGLLDWSGTAAARPFAGTVRFLHVWVLGEGTWRLVATQLTNQPSPASAGPSSLPPEPRRRP